MNFLGLSKNEIGPDGVKRLCECIGKIQHLSLKSCKLIGPDMELLAKAILQEKKQVLFISYME